MIKPYGFALAYGLAVAGFVGHGTAAHAQAVTPPDVFIPRPPNMASGGSAAPPPVSIQPPPSAPGMAPGSTDSHPPATISVIGDLCRNLPEDQRASISLCRTQ